MLSGTVLFYREVSCINETRSDHAFTCFSPEVKWDVIIPAAFHPVTYSWQLIINFFKVKDSHSGGCNSISPYM